MLQYIMNQQVTLQVYHSKTIMMYKNVSYETQFCPMIAITPDAPNANGNGKLLRGTLNSLSPARWSLKSLGRHCHCRLPKTLFRNSASL